MRSFVVVIGQKDGSLIEKRFAKIKKKNVFNTLVVAQVCCYDPGCIAASLPSHVCFCVSACLRPQEWTEQNGTWQQNIAGYCRYEVSR